MSNATVQLTVSGILADLQNGLSRKDIGQKYGLKGTEVAALFKSPKLKNKKTIKPKTYSFVLVDDTVEAETATPEASVVGEVNPPVEEVIPETPVFNLVDDTEESLEVELDEVEPVEDEGTLWGN